METETIRVGAMTIRFLIDAADSSGSATAFEVVIPAGVKLPAPHSHDGYEETIYGVSGVSRWTIDGTAVDLEAGAAICIPRGAVHHFDNPGDVDAKVLAVVSPGVLGPAYFREVAEIFARSSGGPPDVAAIGEVMLRHGLTPAEPG
ncbi:MAG: cupin domain-containing protein [Gaiellaceae bacterium]